MHLTVSLVHVAASALLVAGVLKLVRPAPGRTALVAAGLPGGRFVGGGVAVIEVVAGLAVLAGGGARAALATGVLYAAFGAFSVRLLRTAPGVPCGCFGATDAPPTAVSVALDVGFAAACLGAAAAGPVPGLDDTFAALGVGGTVAYAELLAVGVFLRAAVDGPAGRSLTRPRSRGAS